MITTRIDGQAPDNSAEPSPVALFAFKRPGHLARTLESLAANPLAASTQLFVFCDGARHLDDHDAVAEVRSVVAGLKGFAGVTPVYRDTNFGLARSIIDGVSQVLATHGRVVVIEDDLLLSPHFLRFMNDGLNRYDRDGSVASIHGYCYPVDEPLPDTFFMRGADCWGWATWSRAWRHFEADGATLLASLRARQLTRAFDLDGSFPYTQMLLDQIAGRNDSWAIRWHASCFLHDMLTLYPGRSLVHNLGNDASGTHRGTSADFSCSPATEFVPVDAIALEESAAARDAFVRFHRRRHTLVRRAVSALQRAIE